MFKKRVMKGKFRPEAGVDDVAEENLDADDSSLSGNAVIEMKLEQQMRRKKLGNEFSSDSSAATDRIERKFKSSVQRSIEQTMDSQFESRVEDGLSSSSQSHEKIMEQYINQKMGIKEAGAASPTKQQSQVDELYRLPDEIKYVSKISNPKGTKEEDKEVGGGDQFLSLGIAEVTLPISFKLSNIEETDESRRHYEMERQAKFIARGRQNNELHSGVAEIPATGTARFWNPHMSAINQQSEQDRIKASEAKKVAVSGPSVEVKASTNDYPSTSGGDGRKRTSNDDHSLNKFRSQQRNRK